MAQALYRKWRSRSFAELVGQPHIVRTLENALETGRVAHAYLFNGPRGTGKTSTARLLAKALCCLGQGDEKPCGKCRACLAIDDSSYLDLNEIDAASNNGVEDVRELRHQVQSAPTEGEVKIFIIDEVHMLSTSAFNALLKTLEEPPVHVYFMLATTEVHRIPATVISRCQRFDFRRIGASEIEAHLANIAAAEGCNVEEAALAMIADSAQGGMRDAIGLLDQVVSFGHDTVSLDLVQSMLGLSDIQAINSFIDSLVAGDKQQGLEVLESVVEQGRSLPEFLKQLVTQLRWIFRMQMDRTGASLDEVSRDQAKVIRGWAERWPEAHTLHALSLFLDTLSRMGASQQPLGQTQHPQILIEIALVQAIDGPARPMPPPAREAVPAQAPVSQPKRTVSVPTPAPRANGARTQAAPARTDPDRTRPGSRVPETEREHKILARMRKRWAEERIWELAKKHGSDRLRNALRHIKGLRVVDNCVYVLFASEADSNLARASEWFHEKMCDYAGDNTALECQHGDDVMIRKPRTGWDGSEAPTAPDVSALSKTMIEEIGAFMKDKIGATELDQQEVVALLARMQQPHNSE